MIFRDAVPQQNDVPGTVYALKIGTPPQPVAYAVDLQTAELVKASALPNAVIVAGSFADE